MGAFINKEYVKKVIEGEKDTEKSLYSIIHTGKTGRFKKCHNRNI